MCLKQAIYSYLFIKYISFYSNTIQFLNVWELSIQDKKTATTRPKLYYELLELSIYSFKTNIRQFFIDFDCFFACSVPANTPVNYTVVDSKRHNKIALEKIISKPKVIVKHNGYLTGLLLISKLLYGQEKLNMTS